MPGGPSSPEPSQAAAAARLLSSDGGLAAEVEPLLWPPPSASPSPAWFCDSSPTSARKDCHKLSSKLGPSASSPSSAPPPASPTFPITRASAAFTSTRASSSVFSERSGSNCSKFWKPKAEDKVEDMIASRVESPSFCASLASAASAFERLVRGMLITFRSSASPWANLHVAPRLHCPSSKNLQLMRAFWSIGTLGRSLTSCEKVHILPFAQAFRKKNLHKTGFPRPTGASRGCIPGVPAARAASVLVVLSCGNGCAAPGKTALPVASPSSVNCRFLSGASISAATWTSTAQPQASSHPTLAHVTRDA
mmetsp:Transcript_35509/g.98150  ORF Transcript_35509/g.98150 Transcript_35509/m.98150 type:complete len:308 (+) Transcript_35509:541-1464(+)